MMESQSAQQPVAQRPLIGLLSFAAPGNTLVLKPLFEGLRELDYDPQFANGVLDDYPVLAQLVAPAASPTAQPLYFRPLFADGEMARVQAFAEQLIALPVDMLVASATPVIKIARDRTVAAAGNDIEKSIPVVMALSGDPVGTGLVNSLEAPGGNVTGMSDTDPHNTGAELLLLRECIPTIKYAGVIWNSQNQAKQVHLTGLREAAKKLGMEIVDEKVTQVVAFEDALRSVRNQGAEAVLPLGEPLMTLNRPRMLQLLEAAGVLSLWGGPEAVEVGAPLAFGPRHSAVFWGAARYIDEILHGKRPKDLPVAPPPAYQLWVNRQSFSALMKKLGVIPTGEIPQSLLNGTNAWPPATVI